MSTSSTYIRSGDTTASINSAANAGWIPLLQNGGTIGFQVNLAATGAPIGAFIFEVTDDDTPLVLVTIVLGPVLVPLAGTYAGATYQPTDGTARLVNFDFGPGQPVPAPTGKWMRMRYARTSGGSAAANAFNVGVSQRGG